MQQAGKCDVPVVLGQEGSTATCWSASAHRGCAPSPFLFSIPISPFDGAASAFKVAG